MTEPDRVPVVLPAGFTPAYLAGSDLFSVMYDYPKLIEAWSKFHQEFDIGYFCQPGIRPAWEGL